MYRCPAKKTFAQPATQGTDGDFRQIGLRAIGLMRLGCEGNRVLNASDLVVQVISEPGLIESAGWWSNLGAGQLVVVRV